MAVNGQPVRLPGTEETAVDAVRRHLGLTGTKLVCGTGVCGACTVSVEGVPVAGCLLPAEDLEERDVVTIEGIADEDRLHPVQAAFLEHDGLQCGYCTPGFVVEAVCFYDRWREAHGPARPDRETIARALAGHLCRCGAYPGIYEAVAAACAGDYDDHEVTTGARVDGWAKVTGTARYTTDIGLDALAGRIVRSDVPHGTLTAFDPGEALSMPGVMAFVPLVEPGHRIRYHGEAVAAVAATDAATARRAAASVVLAIEPRPAAIGAESALAEDAPDVHGWWIPPSNNEAPAIPNVRRKNLVGPNPIGTVRPLKARSLLAEAEGAGDPGLVAGTWSTSIQAHTAFEPHAAVAEWHPRGTLTVYLSTQAVALNRRRLADELDLDESDVEVVSEYVGGAFGAKQSLGPEPVAAARLARDAGRPVRVVLDRAEELTVGGNRPGVEMEFALVGDADGLGSMRMKALADGGASAGSLVASGLPRALYPGAPRILLDYDVVSNAPPGHPFRAPGGPPALFALEQAVDELADRLGSDPIDLRRPWNDRPLRAAMYDWASGHELWRARSRPGGGRFVTGVGAAFGTWFNGHDPGATVTVESGPGGFRVAGGTQDMGNGSRTVLATAVAETLGVDPDMVLVEIGRASLGPGPTSSGSRTTATVAPSAVEAAERVRDLLVDQAATSLGLTGARPTEGGVVHADERLSWEELLPRLEPAVATAKRPPDSRRILPFTASLEGLEFGWGLTESAHLVELEVDTLLGAVRVTRVETRIAAGRIHAPALARSQVEGGVVQGLGMAFYERRRLDPLSGVVVTATLEDYHLPGIGDTPEMEVTFLEQGFEHVPGGGVGLSELSLVAVPAAAANAMANATGRRVRRLPMTPAVVTGAAR